MSHHTIELTVNGAARVLSVPARLTLADLLREQLELTATHLGCEHGVCGACTVLVDGEPARACLLLAVQCHGAEVTTLEGLAVDEELGPVQQAFHEKHALQCGFCTPGIVLSVTALLERTPRPSNDQVLETLGGHLCRCTGYVKIVEAVERASELTVGGAR